MTRMTLWDLDKTLGTFAPIEKGRTDIHLREGIREILEENRQKGILNVLTTNAMEEYAEIALNLAKIRQYFELIFPRDVVMAFEGKKYQDVLTIYGISAEEAEDKIIVIGDNLRDRPIDVPGLTFILDSTYRNSEADASDLRDVLNNLTKNTSFAKGFESMYAQAKQHPKGYKVMKNGFKTNCAMNQGGEPRINLIMLSEPLLQHTQAQQ